MKIAPPERFRNNVVRWLWSAYGFFHLASPRGKPRTQKHLAIAMQKTTLLRILADDMLPHNEGI